MYVPLWKEWYQLEITGSWYQYIQQRLTVSS